jgi:hypothetical protein
MPKRQRDAGFTLAETLISTAMTLLVLGAALTALNASARLTDTTRIISDTNQNIQVAMSLMVRDFVQTGQAVPRGGIPFPTGGGVAPIKRPGPAGSNFTFPAAWTTIPALTPGGSLGPTVLGLPTDIATILYADPNLALNQFPLAAIAADGSTMTVNAATSLAGPDGIKAGDLILFTNAFGSALQSVSAVAGQVVTFAAGDTLGFNQRNGTSGTIMQLQSAVGVFPATIATRMIMISYYVDVITDPTLPRLVRQVNAGPRLAIALGVENLQFTYDLVDGVTNPTNVENANSPNSPNQVRKANLFVLARSLDKNLQTRDYFRNSTATSVGLRSLSFVDRYK